MNLLAIKMLVGNRAQYLGIVSGLTFASLLIIQQMGIFFGFLSLTSTALGRIPSAEIWIADPDIRFVGDNRPMLDNMLLRVRSVPGVAWAVPYYNGMLRARLPDGRGESCVVLGIDDSSMIGGPHPSEMIEGKLENLKRADSIIIDQRTATTMFRVRVNPDDPESEFRPITVGETIELNDRRATIVGICKTLLQLQGEATVFTLYNRAVQYSPFERRRLSYILAAPNQGITAESLLPHIRQATGMLAATPKQMEEKTWAFFIFEGGFGVFFGITVIFGVIIGVGIAGQMFYSFVSGNLRYFAILKAMGSSGRRLVWMVILQATLCGVMGWALGMGLASVFGYMVRDSDQLLFEIPPILFGGSLLLILTISWLSAMLSMRTVIKLDPAEVFK
jgi:putative ABC transport system permease protein